MSAAAWHFLGSGWFAVPAVGTSHYRDRIAAVAQNHQGRAALTAISLTLTPTSDNQADPHAVAVTHEGNVLAHLARDLAPIVRAAMTASAGQMIPATVDAMISGGVTTADRQYDYRIELDLRQPLTIEPATPPTYPEPMRINGYTNPKKQDDGSYLAQVWIPYASHDDMHPRREVLTFVPRGSSVMVFFLANRQGIGLGEKLYELPLEVARSLFGPAGPLTSLESLDRRFGRLRMTRDPASS